MFTILAIQPWYCANAPRYLVDAFERIGCKVLRVGPKYFSHMGLLWPKEDLPIIDLELPRASDWCIDDLIDWATINHTAPDMVFISEETYHNQVTPTTKVPSVLLSEDGWPENYDRVEMVQPVVAYTNHPLGIDLYPRDEIDPRWKYLPGACAPWIHRNLQFERRFDFCMLASFYGRRKELSDKLEEMGLLVWSGQATTKIFVDGYNRSVTTFHNARRGEIKWKFFETTAMGCINISGWSKLFLQLGYKPWHHYIPIETPNENEWPSAEDLYQMINFVRKNPALIRQISNDAREQTLKTATYYHRCKKVFSDLGITDIVAKADEAIEQNARASVNLRIDV